MTMEAIPDCTEMTMNRTANLPEIGPLSLKQMSKWKKMKRVGSRSKEKAASDEHLDEPTRRNPRADPSESTI